MAWKGYIAVYSPRRSIYSPRRSYCPGQIYAHLSGHIYAFQEINNLNYNVMCLFLVLNRKSGIYIIYIGSLRAIYNNIAALTKVFSSSVESLGRHAVPSGFDLERKKPRPRRAILWDVALQDPIYTLHIYKKIVLTNLLWVYNVGQITALRWLFSKIVLNFTV